jgi:hypothetical protein
LLESKEKSVDKQEQGVIMPQIFDSALSQLNVRLCSVEDAADLKSDGSSSAFGREERADEMMQRLHEAGRSDIASKVLHTKIIKKRGKSTSTFIVEYSEEQELFRKFQRFIYCALAMIITNSWTSPATR